MARKPEAARRDFSVKAQVEQLAFPRMPGDVNNVQSRVLVGLSLERSEKKAPSHV